MSAQLCDKCKLKIDQCECGFVEFTNDKKKIKASRYKKDEDVVENKTDRRTAMRAAAIEYANKNLSKFQTAIDTLKTDQKVLCVMFYEVSGAINCAHDISGAPKDMENALEALRTACNLEAADLKKKNLLNVCAEEHLLCVQPSANKRYLFSVAYRKGGTVGPCPKCQIILDNYGIEDIHKSVKSQPGFG